MMRRFLGRNLCQKKIGSRETLLQTPPRDGGDRQEGLLQIPNQRWKLRRQHISVPDGAGEELADAL